MRSPSWALKSIGAERARAVTSGVTMPTVSARNQYALEIARQESTSPAVWITDSMPEYASTHLATPTVTTETPWAKPWWWSAAYTSVTLCHMTAGWRGSRWRKPRAIRFTNTKHAATKMPKVTRAFSRMPRMLSPATAQITPRITPRSSSGPSGTNAVPLITALTVEMHAVRM